MSVCKNEVQHYKTLLFATLMYILNSTHQIRADTIQAGNSQGNG